MRRLAAMNQNRTKIAWPVITLMLDGVLMIVAYAHDAPDWVILVIFFGWWVWLYVYARFFYRA
jgi:hypothetical protein